MRNISLTREFPTFTILTLALFVTGCGQNGADVAKLLNVKTCRLKAGLTEFVRSSSIPRIRMSSACRYGVR